MNRKTLFAIHKIMSKTVLYRVLYLYIIMVLFVLSGSAGLNGQSNAEKNDIIIQAMTDEMNRSMVSLKIDKMEKPYYLEYTVLDVQQWSIQCSFGSIIRSGREHQRLLKVGVRIGDYQLDNTEFIGQSGMYAAIMGTTSRLAIDNDYNALRHDIWFATDGIYKQAVEQFAEKQAFLKSQVEQEQIADFSREEPVQRIKPKQTLIVDRAYWEKVIKELSAIFRQYPAIYESYIEMEAILVHKYYVNIEGSVVRQPEMLFSIEAVASTQANDGMQLKHYLPFYAPTSAGLPAQAELIAGVRQMAEQLTALTRAPVLDGYIGPVLFTEQAAPELFVQVLLPHLSGQYPPLSNEPQISQMAAVSKLVRRLNRRVLPVELSIVDDPLLPQYAKIPLVGGYEVDDQGVLARSLTLVDRGILKELLMSRRPGKGITHSNGHGRAAIMSNTGVQIGNLLITAERGKSVAQLKESLLNMCRAQGLEYGLMIKSFDNPAITGLDSATSARLMQNPQNPSLTTPILIYRVFAKDGREELVRGITVGQITVADLKYISAVGNDSFVHHRLVAPAGGIMGSVFTIFSAGSGGGVRLPVSVVAPSLLFEEVEFEKIDTQRDKLPVLEHPFFAHKTEAKEWPTN